MIEVVIAAGRKDLALYAQPDVPPSRDRRRTRVGSDRLRERHVYSGRKWRGRWSRLDSLHRRLRLCPTKRLSALLLRSVAERVRRSAVASSARAWTGRAHSGQMAGCVVLPAARHT